jgi:PKD repeat protein
MKKLFTILLLLFAGLYLQAQVCQTAFSYQVNMLNEYSFSGYAWNTDSSAINVTSWSWSFGNGSSATGQNPTGIQLNPAGPNLVCLTIETSTGCSSTYCDTIFTGGGPTGCEALFYAWNDSSCQTCYAFYDYSTGNVLNWAWDFGDGATSAIQNPTHQYTLPGTYTVCLTITTDTCTNTFCNTLVVDTANPGGCQMYIASVYVQDESALGAADGSIDITVVGGTPPLTYLWNTGVTTEDISGLTEGVYTVAVNDSGGCALSFSAYVGNLQDSLVVIDTLGTTPIDTCFNFTVDSVFLYNTVVVDSFTVQITWAFMGGGMIAYLTETYYFSTSGTYIVSVTINCGTKSLVTYYADAYLSNAMISTGIVQNDKPEILGLYPNPATDFINLSYSLMKNSDLSVIVYNMAGQPVMTENISGQQGNNMARIETSSLSQGFYMMIITDNSGNRIVKKFIK